eukprot:GDKH01020651.1.p1 GENE.GDKH01020651.1~~GDKH01020651.1.p1  ORF type:complete len:253 (+),score=22.27 GDKH01020651.1:128-886(+)
MFSGNFKLKPSDLKTAADLSKASADPSTLKLYTACCCESCGCTEFDKENFCFSTSTCCCSTSASVCGLTVKKMCQEGWSAFLCCESYQNCDFSQIYFCCKGSDHCIVLNRKFALPPSPEVPLNCAVCGFQLFGPAPAGMKLNTACLCMSCGLVDFNSDECCAGDSHILCSQEKHTCSTKPKTCQEGAGKVLCCEQAGHCKAEMPKVCCKSMSKNCGICDCRAALPCDQDQPFAIALLGIKCVAPKPAQLTMG